MSKYGIILEMSDQSIIQYLNRVAAKKIATNFYKPSTIRLIENAIRKLVINAIKNSQTWKSLHGEGDLQTQLDAHFGIPSSQRDVNLDNLLKVWAQEIKVVPNTIKYTQQQFILAYDFYAIEANWANVLGSDQAVTHNNSDNAARGKAPKIIPWLSWLLVGGDRKNIEGYHIDFDHTAGSRSGKATMRIKGEWAIPTEFGPFATDNNFVTRALKELAAGNELKPKLNSLLENVAAFDGVGIAIAGFDMDDI